MYYNYKRFITAAAWMGLLFVFSAAAQRNSGRASQKQGPARSVFATQPIDENVESLPPRYVGHSLVALIPALETYQKKASKSEFETTVAYRNRLTRLRQGKMTEGLTFSDLLAFPIVQGEEMPLSVKYDADTEALAATLEIHSRYRWVALDRATGTYIGRNAFGRRVKVIVERHDEFALTLDGKGLTGLFAGEVSEYLAPPVVRHYQASPGIARLAKTNLRALILYRLAETDTYEYSYYADEPTIDSPYETHHHSTGIHGEAVGLWFYDFPTGRIYEKLKLIKQEPKANAFGELISGIANALTEDTSPVVTNESTPLPRVSPTPSSVPTPQPPTVLNDKAISLPQPAYPAIAKAAHAYGSVSVLVTIDESGRVISARAIRGHPLLQAAAVQAAQGARFSPTLLSGQAVKVTGVLNYEFPSNARPQ